MMAKLTALHKRCPIGNRGSGGSGVRRAAIYQPLNAWLVDDLTCTACRSRALAHALSAITPMKKMSRLRLSVALHKQPTCCSHRGCQSCQAAAHAIGLRGRTDHGRSWTVGGRALRRRLRNFGKVTDLSVTDVRYETITRRAHDTWPKGISTHGSNGEVTRPTQTYCSYITCGVMISKG